MKRQQEKQRKLFSVPPLQNNKKEFKKNTILGSIK